MQSSELAQDIASAVVEMVLAEQGTAATPREMGERAAGMAASFDPASVPVRQASALAQRDVVKSRVKDGVATVRWTLDALSADLVMGTLDVIARHGMDTADGCGHVSGVDRDDPADPGWAARRSDGLLALVTGEYPAAGIPAGAGPGPGSGSGSGPELRARATVASACGGPSSSTSCTPT